MVAVDVTPRKSASFIGVGLHELLQHDGVDFVRFQASDVIVAEGDSGAVESRRRGPRQNGQV